MTKTEAMQELKAHGSPQTRKTYRRHGVRGEMFGVSYAILGKMKKKIKVDQSLAEQLWTTGNLDAQALATASTAAAWPARCRTESKIHASKNWVKYAMNNALINIGVRNPALEKKAIAAAKRIGEVQVDHGETGCKTPDAAAYIKKTVAYNKQRASKRRSRTKRVG